MRPPKTGRVDVWDSVLPAFGLRVSATGRRVWIAAIRKPGSRNPTRQSIGTYPELSLADARTKARELMAHPAATRTAPRLETFEAVAAEYITRHVKARHKRALETEQMIQNKLVAPWRGRPVASIGRHDVLSVLDVEMDAGRERTANKLLVVVRRLFAWAIDRGLLAEGALNPAAAITKPGREASRDRVLSDAELAVVWRAAGEMGWPWSGLARLLICTALRLSEVAELRWTEIDLERRCLILSGERTKSGRSQETPLNGLAVETIGELPRVADGYVFPANRHGSDNPVSGFSKMKRRLDQLSGVQNWRLHDLRRTAASHMARLGVAPQVLARVLNHSPGAALPGVLAVYNRHSYDNEARAALEAWSRELERITGRSETKVIALRK